MEKIAQRVDDSKVAKRAVVVGATGLVGSHLLELLLRDSGYEKVTVITRREIDIVNPKLEQIVIGLDKLDTVKPEIFKSAIIFCTLGTTIKIAKTKEKFEHVDYHYPLNLGQLAKSYGADQMLIVTAMGANAKSRFFYNRVKGRVEDELKKLGLPSLHIVRPSLLLGERQEHRSGERWTAAISEKVPFVFRGVLKKYKPIAARTVASAMIRLAAHHHTGVKIVESGEIQP